MAIIPGVTVEWTLSPRIIIIPIPETEVTIDDLQDTLQDLEDDEEGMVWPHLRELSGGEDLGGGTSVGLTMELQNAQIQFEGRTTPIDNGSGRTCDATDATGTQLYVDDADFVSDGIYTGCTVWNANTAEMATVTEIVDLHTLNHFALSGGAGGGWTSGDNYAVYPNVAATISGGNLVAVDDGGSAINPVFQSPNVQVTRTSSASATLQEQADIEYSSFNGGITLDVSNGTSGTEFPTGTPRQPVNNWADAISIASSRGFKRIFVLGNTVVGSGVTLDNLVIEGQGPKQTTVTLQSGSSTLSTDFEKCEIEGPTDGQNLFTLCYILNLTNVGGEFHQCRLDSTITLNGSSNSNFYDCWSGVPGTGSPTIDMNSSGSSLTMRNYSGGITISNKTGAAEDVSIDLDPGTLNLDPSVTAGTIAVTGTGSLNDNSGGTTIVNLESLISQETISSAQWDELVNNTRVSGSYGKQLTDNLKLKRRIP